jgi:hypothetical protein
VASLYGHNATASIRALDSGAAKALVADDYDGTFAYYKGNAGGTGTDYVKITSDGSTNRRTGTTTDPRALIGHLYIWAKDYIAP